MFPSYITDAFQMLPVRLRVYALKTDPGESGDWDHLK